MSTIEFLIHHRGTLISLALAAAPLIKALWALYVRCHANSRALRLVCAVIEELDRSDVKQAIAQTEARLAPAIQDALDDHVATVDPGKPTPSTWSVLIRELVRGIR